MKYFTKDRYVLEFNGVGLSWCFKDSETDQEYIDYKRKCLPKWYNEFSIHDDQIKGFTQMDDKIILEIAADDYKHTRYQLIFYNPHIIDICELKNAWCLYDELYVSDNSCEYHLMVADFNNNRTINYFTVKCSNLELIINGRIYKAIGNKEDKSIWDGCY